jgi:hypothetical protein
VQLPAFILRLWQGPARSEASSQADAGGGIRIAQENMRHGVLVMRGREEVRQVVFILRGQLRVVTSGDIVEPWVYEALVARGVLLPVVEQNPPMTRGAA